MPKLKVMMYVCNDDMDQDTFVLEKYTDLGPSNRSLEDIAEGMRCHISDAIDRGMDDTRVLDLSEKLLEEPPIPLKKTWTKPTMSFKPWEW